MNWRKKQSTVLENDVSTWERYQAPKALDCEHSPLSDLVPSSATTTRRVRYPEAVETRPGDLFRSPAEIYKNRQ
ncbi:hypothetical protein OAO01_01635 [Oligoflexia bacterium]|nr:hypothetical protein [Oligoflexia bacterium]